MNNLAFSYDACVYFRATAPYRKIGVGQKCSLCVCAAATCVLYPCRHCCVCQTCARQEQILAENRTNFVSVSAISGAAAMPAVSGAICPVCAKDVEVGRETTTVVAF